MITTNLFLFLCHTTIDWMLILMVYVYNFKDFTGETAISSFGVVIHNKKIRSDVIIHCDNMLCTHSNVIIHYDVIIYVPSNVVTHCCATMGHP